MIILVSKADKTVQDFTMSYNIDENGMYISENMQGHRVEEPYASERFDIIDIADSKIPVDDTGNYISLKPKHWLYVDGQLVKNFNYVDEDKKNIRKSKQKELENLRNKLWEILRQEKIDEAVGITKLTMFSVDKMNLIAQIKLLTEDLQQVSAR